MLNISKYHKLIVGCSAIATATISGFVQSADAAGHLDNHTDKSNSGTTLITQLFNGSNNGSNNGSTTTGTNSSNSTGVKPPGVFLTGEFGPFYFDSNNGGAVPTSGGPFYYDPKGPNGPGYYPYTNQGDVAIYYFGNGPQGQGYYSYNVNAVNGSDGGGPTSAPSAPTVIGTFPGGTGPDGGPGSIGPDGRPTGSSRGNSARSGYTTGNIVLAQNSLSRFNAAMSKYEAAAAALAAAEAATPNTSSRNEPIRYGREPGDIAACGCPNADTTTAGTPSKELVAARAAEAEAAAELAAAKAEARQFLESVKDSNGSNSSSSFQPIW